MPTVPPTAFDWRGDKTLLESVQYMLEQKVACDVTFLVGEQIHSD